jgi:hypothetical protein
MNGLVDPSNRHAASKEHALSASTVKATRIRTVSEGDGVLRFDTKTLYEKLNSRRQESNMTWQDAASQIGVAAASLQHLSKGGRTSFPQVMRILRWLGRSAGEFTRVAR